MIKQELPLASINASEPLITAAVIDDAFDNVKPGDIGLDTFRGFMQVANGESSYKQADTALTIPKIDLDEVEEDSSDYINFLNFLWNNRNYSDDFRKLLKERLFHTKFEKIGQLEQICENLNKIKIEVTAIGSNLSTELENFAKHKYNLIFIDYYLGESEDEKAIENAIKNIRLIHSKYDEGKKPATVLMSTAHVESKAVEFYEKAQIMARPMFFHKNDLQDTYLIKLIAGILKKEFSNRDQLEKYGLAITDAATKALETFKAKISQLRVEDFIFIQNTVLQADKQPLGDYLEWLFGAYWGHVLFEQSNLRNESDKISLFYIEDAPVIHHQPSDIVSEMYMTALFEFNLKDIEPHPAFLNKANGESSYPIDQGNLMPYLHLGDLFVSEFHNEVWIIMTPQCDLERDVPSDRSIMLLPGKLIPIGKADSDSSLRTEFFRVKGNCYRIVWEPKNVISKPLKDLIDWKKMQATDRLFRLRLPFAIELQQALVIILSRVGLPVPPPLTQPLEVEICLWNEAEKKYDVCLHSELEYCFRLVTKTEEKIKIRYKLTGKFILDFEREMIAIVGKISSEYQALDDKNSTNGKALAKKQEKINELLTDFDAKFLNLTFIETKKDGLKEAGLGKTQVRLNHDLNANSSVGLFLINIIDPESFNKTST